MIAITVADATRVGAELAATKLRALGYDVRMFVADGVGGMNMERMIRAGEVQAVLDLTLSELLSRRHPDRLTAAGLMGIPQVIAPGGMDEEESPEVLDAKGKEIAEKASAAKGPVRIVLPLRGISDELPTAAVNALFQSIRNWVYPVTIIIESENNINSEIYISSIIDILIAMLQ